MNKDLLKRIKELEKLYKGELWVNITYKDGSMEKKKANLPLIDEINEPLAQSYSYKEIAKQLETVLCSLV